MKKATLGILAGIGIGLVLIGLIFGILFFNWKNKENQFSANPIETVTESEKESETESDRITETESETMESTQTENTENADSEATEIVENPDNVNPNKPEVNPAPIVTPTVPEYPYYIKVNRQMNCITIYSKDANGNYTIPVKAMVCSVGKEVGDTPTGVYQTKEKYVWRKLFGGTYGHYTTRIVGHILFHSVPYSLASNDSLLTEEYNKLGEAASAGCIRLSVQDAKWIYDNCGIGTTVEIYDSPEVGPLGKPSSLKIDAASSYKGWDPTDPHASNPWKTVKPVIAGVKNQTFERCEKADYTSYVTATDSWGNKLNVNVSGQVDLRKPGNYTVTYSVVDALGNTAQATANIIVQDLSAPDITQNQKIVIYDSSTDIEAIIRNALSVKDNGETMDNSVLVLDVLPLTEAMSRKAYDVVLCTATAADAYGNTSTVSITVHYENEEVPGTDAPGTETPGTETPNAETPNTGMPETEMSDFKIPYVTAMQADGNGGIRKTYNYN